MADELLACKERLVRHCREEPIADDPDRFRKNLEGASDLGYVQ